jgi:hypothetical protein
MARTAIAIREVVRAGVVISNVSVYVLVDRANGMTIPNDGFMFLALQNINGATPYDMTLLPGPLVNYDGVVPLGRLITVPANSQRFYGPFPVTEYGDNLQVDVVTVGAETNVRITAYHMGPNLPAYAAAPFASGTVGARVEVPVTSLSRTLNGIAYGTGTGEVSTSASGHYFDNDGQVFLHVRNASGGTMNNTISSTPQKKDGQQVGGVAGNVPATSERLIGPFPASAYNGLDGHALWNTDTAGQSIKAYWLGFEG